MTLLLPRRESGYLLMSSFASKRFSQRLKKRLRRIRRDADRHGHFLGRRRKISRVRRDSRQRQVAGPMIRILLGDLMIDLERALEAPHK